MRRCVIENLAWIGFSRIRLVLRHGFSRPREFEENRALRAFHNRAQQAITLFRRAFGRPGSAHAVISAGDIDSGDFQIR